MALKPLNFESVAISELVTPENALPEGHCITRGYFRDPRDKTWEIAFEKERAAIATARVHASPSLVGYVMGQVKLGRTELVEEEMPPVPFESMAALRKIILREGGAATDTFSDNTYMAIGAYLITYADAMGINRLTLNTPGEGSLLVKARKSAEAAREYVEAINNPRLGPSLNTWGY